MLTGRLFVVSKLISKKTPPKLYLQELPLATRVAPTGSLEKAIRFHNCRGSSLARLKSLTTL